MLWSFNKCSVSYSAGFTSSAFFLTHCFFNIFISIGNVCMTFFLRACLIGTPSKYGDYRPIPSLVSLLTGLQFIYLFVNLFNIYFSFSLSLYLILLLFFITAAIIIIITQCCYKDHCHNPWSSSISGSYWCCSILSL